MATLSLGQVRPRPRGPWDETITDYKTYDWVVFGGSAWIALQDVPADYHPDSQPLFWVLFGAKGEPGQDGARGADGAPGIKGADGARGEQGLPGPATPISDAVDKTDSDVAASSKAVKMAYDKALTAEAGAAAGTRLATIAQAGQVNLDGMAQDGSATAAPGGFGLGAKTIFFIPNNGDLNTYISGGLYAVSWNPNFGVLNAPVDSNLILEVIPRGFGHTLVQIAYDTSVHNGNRIYKRTYEVPVGWANWIELPAGITDSTSTISSSIAASATAVKTAYDAAIAGGQIASMGKNWIRYKNGLQKAFGGGAAFLHDSIQQTARVDIVFPVPFIREALEVMATLTDTKPTAGAAKSAVIHAGGYGANGVSFYARAANGSALSAADANASLKVSYIAWGDWK